MPKFCGNCGAQLEDNMKFCGNCGVTCPPSVQNTPVIKERAFGRYKKVVALLILAVISVIGIYSILSFSNNPCDWCGDSPSKVFKTNDGGKAYVCSDCRKECTLCGDRASKYYENYFDMIVFVCKDCYKEMV